MIEDPAMLRAVIAAPDDDAPRLVYADWLDEQGDPDRALFIRTQVERARTPRDDPRRRELLAIERELLDRYACVWAEPLGERIDEWVFRRGFVAKIDSGEWVRRPESFREVLRLAPIRHLRTRGQFSPTAIGNLAGLLPDLIALTGLELWGLYNKVNRHMRTILSSPHLARLRNLILAHDRNGDLVADKVLVEALTSPLRSNLRELAVNVNNAYEGPSARVILAMTRSRHLRKLRKINLSCSRLDAATLASLFRAMPKLDRIDLSACVAPADFWDLLLARAAAGGLRWLRLFNSGVADASGHGVGDTPRYVDGFARSGVRVDWETQILHPGIGGCWAGHSWEDYRRQHMLGAWPHVRVQDFDGLERAFRRDCMRHGGERLAAEIDALPFGRYSRDLAAAFQRAVELANSEATGHVVVFRADTHYRWGGEFDVCDSSGIEPFDPGLPAPYSGETSRKIAAPAFPEADEAYRRFGRTGVLDPDSAYHYLIARAAAALGHLVAGMSIDLPILFVAGDVALKLNP